MISKTRLKYLKSLMIKKYRNKFKQVLLEGTRLINEAINAKADIESVYCLESFLTNPNHKEFIDLLNANNISISKISKLEIKGLVDSVNNQGIVAVASIDLVASNKLENRHQLILDSISDPGNLGNIIRTADWFGISNIYLSNDSVDPYNAKVIRSAMGAHFYLNIIEINITQHIMNLKKNNFTIIAADLNGENIYNWDFPEKWALILGNEAHGISNKVRKLIDCKITIPKQGNIESLNVSMAAGILLSHIKKI